MSNLNKARGFYTWKDLMTHHTRSKRVLGKFLLFWQKSQLFRAFRTWADNHNAAVKNELEEARKGKQAQSRALAAERDEINQ